jgi:hypothetical protein
MHGDTIDVSSEGPGHGSTFRVRLLPARADGARGAVGRRLGAERARDDRARAAERRAGRPQRAGDCGHRLRARRRPGESAPHRLPRHLAKPIDPAELLTAVAGFGHLSARPLRLRNAGRAGFQPL